MGEPLPIVRDLHARRRALDISMREAGARSGVDAAVIGTWERGDRRPYLETVYTYAAIYGLEPVLKEGDGAPVPLAACAVLSRHIRPAGRLPIVRQLRAGRHARELPVPQLAAQLGVSHVSVVAWENGSRRIALHQAYAYAAALHLGLVLERLPGRLPALTCRPYAGNPR